MKKITLLFILMLGMISRIHAQTITYYGTSTGTLGKYSSYFGYNSGKLATDFSNANSFLGAYSGQATSSGSFNIAMGVKALFNNTSGSENTALGAYALYNNNANGANTATGAYSLYSNTSGGANIATGAYSLYSNTTGGANTANGYKALYSNTIGHYSTAIGYQALYNNTDGNYNSAIGQLSLYNNKSGHDNTATGVAVLINNYSGNYNSGYGNYSLAFNESGSGNSAFGYNAGPSMRSSSLSNTTAIGNGAVTLASNEIVIGNSDVTKIGGQVSWSTISDGRFKKEEKEDVSGLDFINQLRPVSYIIDRDAFDKFAGIPDHVKQQQSIARTAPIRQTGFIAQEVEAIIKKKGFIFHGLQAPQNEYDHYSIRYAEFVVPLVKAVQELTAKADEQQKEISELKDQLRKYNDDGVIDSKRSTGAMLFQNSPNPFSMDTEINMSLPEASRQVNIIVYSMDGKQVKVMQIHDRGRVSIKIQGSELKAGMYIYTLIVDNKEVDTKRMILTGY